MQLKTKNCEYAASNCFVSISPDLKKINAQSYGWWRFVYRDSVGNVIFNNSNYSSSTNNHQSNVSSILSRLNIHIDITLRHTTKNMVCGQTSIDDEILGIESVIKKTQAKMKVKGSWKKTNLERAAFIKRMEYDILDLTRYRTEYLDKKKIPVKTRKISDQYIAGSQSYHQYFLKPNGALKTNEIREFLKTLDYYYRDTAPQSIDKIKELFGLKTLEQTVSVLLYEYCNDLNNQIPDETSDDRIKLNRWLKTNDITGDNLNSFQLDRLHVYLTNKMNRPAIDPDAVPYTFDISPRLELLRNHKDVRLLDNPAKLRGEGKKQSHCIGGSDYINQCKNDGFQALNFKGYTFFLDNDLMIDATTGKYNCETPEKIQHELNQLLGA